MQIGFIGLGKMGTRMVEKLLHEGHKVVVWNRTKEIISNFKFQMSNFQLDKDLAVAESVEGLIKQLQKPRVIWLMLPAGEPTESILDELGSLVDIEAGDILIDGGNSYYKDTQRRYDTFQKRGIRFLGIGVSGGVHALKNGYPLMVGGDKGAYLHIDHLLDSLAKPGGGHAYFGEGGAGHFVKMVHNGIEYGMMQALGEGFGVLEKAPYKFDLSEIAKLWQKNTIVSGFLTDRVVDALANNSGLSDIDGVIEASGEGEWAVNQAKEEGVPIENIEQSLKFRTRSKTDKAVSDSFAAKMVASLRAEFGGHEIKKKG